jgi:hypothetical protein
MSYRFNPFTGLFDNVSGAGGTVEYAEKVAAEFNCAAEVVVGDLVRPSETDADTVLRVTSNTYSGLVFGIVIEKISSVRCKVLVSGKITGLTALDLGKAIYVNDVGGITTTPPLTGHRQKLGISINATTAFLLPSMEKVILA